MIADIKNTFIGRICHNNRSVKEENLVCQILFMQPTEASEEVPSIADRAIQFSVPTPIEETT